MKETQGWLNDWVMFFCKKNHNADFEDDGDEDNDDVADDDDDDDNDDIFVVCESLE